jgi:RNA polymerase sigma factor (sigma-70 family)
VQRIHGWQDNETIICRRAGVGNQTALKQLYDLESRRLYGIALRIVRRPETAADVLQDAFIQIWQNARSYSTERGDATAWLIGIVRYRALDAVRKLRREILSGDPTLGDGAEDFDIIEEIDRTRRSHSVLQPLSAASTALALYIALKPVPPAASFVAILHAPQHEQVNWVAMAGRRGLLVRAAAGATPPPSGRAFELWAIAPGTAIPQSLGVIPRDGVFRLDALPPSVRDGGTLAISVEPPGGSPTKQPTGPVVFVGALSEM